jgi:excisionase family DNA binding protein
MRAPVGLVLDAQGRIVLDPDLGVQQAFRSLYEKFDEVGSARQVLGWMLENGIRMPRRVGGTGLFSRVIWVHPTYPAVHAVFENPRYAGAYVRGRTETYLRVEEGEPRSYSRKLPIDKWRVVIPGAHPGYISWEQYLRNRERMRQNSPRNQGRGAPGRGPALLQGLIRCGCCASRMQTHYRSDKRSGKKQLRPFYNCRRECAELFAKGCPSVNAPLVDRVVQEAFLDALEPARLEISAKALERLEESTRAAERHWELKLERARYEAERAQRQYDQVEPENRLVARDLERRWEERLQELKSIEGEYTRWKQRKESPWNAERIDELRGLVKDVRTLWNAETTSSEDRKELLRLLIEDVWLFAHREERQIEVRILWKGASQTVHRAVWWINGHGIKEEVLRRVRELQNEGLLDGEIAERLNTEGYRRTDGGSFVRHNVMQIRRRYGIRKVPRPDDPDVYNAQEAARKLGVTTQTIRGLIRDGVLEATRDRRRTELRIKITQEDEARLRGQWRQENEWTMHEVAQRLGVPGWQVYYWFDQGRLGGRRTRVGRRLRLFIPEKEVRKLEQRLGSNKPR